MQKFPFFDVILVLALCGHLISAESNAVQTRSSPPTPAKRVQQASSVLPSVARTTPVTENSTSATPASVPPGSNLLSNKLQFLTNRPFNDFDWNLAKLIARSQKGNWIASTTSVKLILGMLYLGLQDQDAAAEIEHALSFNNTANDPLFKDTVIKTFSEILKTLEESKNKEYELNIANKMFYDTIVHLNDTYASNLKNFFQTESELINFKQREQTIKIINSWCKNVTDSKIKELISANDVNDQTVMILVNAIYFRGEWEKQFSANYTKPALFYTSMNSSVSVPTMFTSQHFHYYNINHLETHLVRLPYLGGKFAMYLFIPYSEKGSKLFAEKIDPVTLSYALNNMTQRHINLHLPKFHFESDHELIPLLQHLKIKELFKDTTNLSNIGYAVGGNLAVSNIIQKSGIEVNEKGSVAYATTAATIDTRFGEEALNIDASRPFFFLIADEQKDTIVFIGGISNPSNNLSTAVEEDILGTKIKPEETEEVEEEVLKDKYNYFDKELLKELASTEVDKNIIISPASIKSTMALLIEGTAGRTQDQLIHALRLPAADKETTNTFLLQQAKSLKSVGKSPLTILNSQNRIYVSQDEKIRNEYRTNVKNNFYTEIEQLDFSNADVSAQKINAWVNDATEGMIPELVTRAQIDASSRLFLINCIYFKADWNDEFDPKNTRSDCFHNLKNQCLRANMMTGVKKLNYMYSRDMNAQIVELPFKDTRYSMVLMLPDDQFGIYRLVKDLIHQNMNKILKELQVSTVNITIPRTTIEFSSSLSKVLQKVDVKDVFTNTANISGIFESTKPLYLKDIIHKAKIEINEKGAKAAAVTEGNVVLLSLPQKYTFEANRPFLLFIRDTTMSGFLFEGLVLSPDPASEPKGVSPPSIQISSGNRRPSGNPGGYSSPNSHGGARPSQKPGNRPSSGFSQPYSQYPQNQYPYY